MTYKVTVVFGEMNLLTGKMCLSMIEAMRFAATMLEDEKATDVRITRERLDESAVMHLVRVEGVWSPRT